MNKVLKGLVAVAATAAMAVAGFAGAASATAEETTATKYQITVPESDTHTYNAYQIFKGDLNDAGTVLSNITAGSDFKADNAAGTDGANLTAAQAAEKIATGTYADDTAKLKAIQAFANLTTVCGSVSKDAPLSAEPGYYLFKDKDSTAGKDDAATLFIVKVVGNQEIKRKADQPSVEKKVQDTNDSDETTSDWQDSADYDVNDKVPFQLTATLPTDATDFAAYKTYKLVFHDSQSAGLTFNNDITVKYGDKVVSSDSYTVDTTGLNEGETFRVTINDVKTVKDTDGQPIAVVAGGKFTVAYSSTLNSNSVIGSAGNPNKVSLEYSNNPNVGGEGETGKTPEDTVIVFTYQLDVNKTFNGTVNDNDLPEFTLYKKVGASDGYTKEVAKVKVVKNSDGKYVASFPRVDDGLYKLVETKVPDGFNKADDTYLEIKADHDVTADNPALKDLTITVKSVATKGDLTTGTVTASVVNNAGSNLPSTGGMGTVLLYVAGIAVFVLAGATLVMALRRRNA